MNPIESLLKSRKFMILILDTIVSVAAHYLIGDNALFLIAAIQPVALAVIVGITVEDYAAKRAAAQAGPLDVMDPATALLARIFGQRGFAASMVGSISTLESKIADWTVNGLKLTANQIKLFTVCLLDAKMFSLILAVFDRYEVVKKENGLNAEPWYGDIVT